jgi:hypothetical protein
MQDTILQAEETIQNTLESLPHMHLGRELADALKFLAPPGYRPVVELQENGKKKRRTAPADTWTPETGEILISFSKDSSPGVEVRPAVAETASLNGDPNLAAPRSTPGSTVRSKADSSGTVHPKPAHHAETPNLPNHAERELCEGLEEAERQGRAFVALKWFRDDFLASKGFAWAEDPKQRQEVLARAIESGLIVTNRIPNPRSPFPTSTVRLNRARRSSQTGERRFSPIRIKGEPLSSTILRDRGDR